MDYSNNNFDFIERFLDDELTREEIQTFSTRLIEDPEFLDQFENRKAMNNLWNKAKKFEEIKIEVCNCIQGEKNKVIHIFRPSYLAWAAVMLVLLGTFIVFFIYKNPPTVTSISIHNKPGFSDTLAVHRGEKQVPKTRMQRYENFGTTTVTLIFPVDGSVFSSGDKITFKWKVSHDSVSQLYIFSEQNNMLVFKTVIKSGVHEYTYLHLNLKPGKYYWFVGAGQPKRTFTLIK